MTRIRPAGAAALVAALAIAVHAPTVRNGFVWDDEAIVVQNPATRDLSRLGEVILSPDETPPYYRPLNRASYLVDHAAFGMNPAGFHAVNVALHAASTSALFLLVLSIGGSTAAALAASALFAVHPVHVEAVAFVTARNNLFCALFSLGSLLALRASRPWASGALLFLGLLSKEPAAMVVPILAAMAWRAPGRARALAPHALALVVYAILRAIALDGALGGGPPSLRGFVFGIPAFLGLVVFPKDLTVFHPPPALGGISLVTTVLAWGAVAAALAAAVRTRRPLLVLGVAWFALQYVPISGLVSIPSDPFAERYLYLPAIGLWIVAADLFVHLEARLAWKRSLAAAAVVILAALAARTVARTLDWRDDVSLFASAARVDPASARARFNLGVALKDTGDLDGARREWEAALALRPGDAETLTQLGTLAAVRGDLVDAERLFREALRHDPRQALAHYNLGLVCERTGRADEAASHFDAMIAIAPRGYEALVDEARRRRAALDRAARPAF